MDLLALNAELKERITVLDGSIATITTERNTANARITSLEATNTQLETDLASLRLELTTARQALTDEQASNVTAIAGKDTRITTLEGELTTLKATQKTAEQLALERTGKGGNAGVTGGGSKAVLSRQEAMKEYAAIKDPAERGEYYLQHKAIMFPPKQ